MSTSGYRSDRNIPHLAALRLDPRDDADLVWFFGDAEGALGLHAINLEPTARGDIDAGIAAFERQIEAATRYRRIARTLERMPRRLRRVLQRWCGPHRAPQLLAAIFGFYAGIAPLTPGAQALEPAGLGRGLDSLCARGLHGEALVRDEARSRLRLIGIEAEGLLVEASRAYALARPRRRDVVRTHGAAA